MAIGTSDGLSYEDLFEMVAPPITGPSKEETQFEQNDILDQMPSYPEPAMPPGGGTKLAGDFPAREPAPRTDMPNETDVEFARQNDMTYGDPVARYTTPGIAKMDTVPIEWVPGWYNTGKEPKITPKDVDQGAADYIYRAWLGSRRSAISQLGFDMKDTVLSPSNTSRDLNIQGFYNPETNKMWANSKYESAVIHESVHRGLQALQKEGLIPKLSMARNEMLTRLLMNKHFSSIEEDELGGSKAYEAFMKDTKLNEKNLDLDKIEEIAAQYIAKKRPMGPR